MEIAGYIAAIFIGISLGLIGGGGSILTVPVLVYLFRLDAFLATTYSLFIVGMSSLVGAISEFKNRLVDFKTAILFGFPSIVAVFVTRAYILPVIPEQILDFGFINITKHLLMMLLFAVLMVMASLKMIKKCEGENCLPKKTDNEFLVIFQGFLVGMVTGLIGAGGGFLIIPALVSLLGLDFKRAIGTSLIIIAANSLFGFAISTGHLVIEWLFLIKILGLSVLGVFVGNYLSKRIDGKRLKPIFGWFILIMGIFIITKEILTH